VKWAAHQIADFSANFGHSGARPWCEDASGNLWSIFTASHYVYVYTSADKGKTWLEDEVFDTPLGGGAARDANIRCDPDGNLHASWSWNNWSSNWQSNYAIHYSKRESGAWSTPAIVQTPTISTRNQTETSMDIGGEGDCHIAWKEWRILAGVGEYGLICYRRRYEDGSWGTTKELDVSGASRNPSRCDQSPCVGANYLILGGNPFVVFMARGWTSVDDRRIILRENTTGTAWPVTQVFQGSAELTGTDYPRIAFDLSGYPYVVAMKDDEVYIRWETSEGWQTEEQIYAGGSTYNSLGIDQAGLIYMTRESGEAPNQSGFKYKDGSGWCSDVNFPSPYVDQPSLEYQLYPARRPESVYTPRFVAEWGDPTGSHPPYFFEGISEEGYAYFM
jgi:hypothetical protein